MLFPELPYPEYNQRKIPTSVLPTPLPVPQPHNSTSLTRPTPTIPPIKKEDIGMNQSSCRNQQQPQINRNNQPKTNGVTSTVQNSGNKSFTCTICGKSLARKDKLVIHTRIHTGEKPYICEVCDKAFARRDKLVIHMNKMKHRTPTNIAPLGKRTNVDKSGKNKAAHEEVEEIPKAAAISIQTAAANWSCKLCGQMMTTPEESAIHTSAHIEEKMTGIGVMGPTDFTNSQRPIGNFGGNSVHMPGISNSTYPPVPQHSSPYQPFSIPDRQFCPVCKQTFSKSEFMLHVKAHFDVIKPDLDSLRQPQVPTSGAAIIDNASICS